MTSSDFYRIVPQVIQSITYDGLSDSEGHDYKLVFHQLLEWLMSEEVIEDFDRNRLNSMIEGSVVEEEFLNTVQ